MPAFGLGLIAAQGALPFTCGYPALVLVPMGPAEGAGPGRGGGPCGVSPEPCMMVLSLPPAEC